RARGAGLRPAAAHGRGARGGRAAARRLGGGAHAGLGRAVRAGAGEPEREREGRGVRDGGERAASAERALRTGLDALARARAATPRELGVEEVGTVAAVSQGVAIVGGLPTVTAGETVTFSGGGLGLVSELREDEVGVVVLRGAESLAAGATAHRTGRVLDVPVGDALLGRVVDALGAPLDGRGPVEAEARLPVERPATPIVDRAPVSVPLHTGVKVVDALFPVGRGQRELVVGDRQTGKTTLALTAVLAQRDTGVRCVYC